MNRFARTYHIWMIDRGLERRRKATNLNAQEDIRDTIAREMQEIEAVEKRRASGDRVVRYCDAR